MQDFEKEAIWKYILNIDNSEKAEEIKEEIRKRYSGTVIECFFINYEMEKLAETIKKQSWFRDYKDFMERYDEKVQYCIYKSGLDYLLM